VEAVLVSKIRAQRIGDRIREELSIILISYSSDPRLSGVYVTGVDLDRELEFATVYVSAVEGSVRSKEILEGLQHAQGFLRTELARRIVLRMFPRLRFRWDATYERADKIEKLFAQLHKEDQAAKGGFTGKSSSLDREESAAGESAEAGADE
jgi:ribosome-binding factor A